jgi:hypothetical protein
MPKWKEALVQADRIDGSQGDGVAEAIDAVARSRETAERLWAEIGRLLAAAGSGNGRVSGIGAPRPKR